MKIFMFLIILLITASNCGPINIGNKKIDLKKKEIEGYYIEVYAKRDKYGVNCNAFLTVINKDSNINELYVEIQAINKDKKIISITNFLIKQAKKNEIINKINTFSEIQSCGKIEDLNIIAG
jgi:hypothetical protein